MREQREQPRQRHNQVVRVKRVLQRVRVRRVRGTQYVAYDFELAHSRHEVARHAVAQKVQAHLVDDALHRGPGRLVGGVGAHGEQYVRDYVVESLEVAERGVPAQRHTNSAPQLVAPPIALVCPVHVPKTALDIQVDLPLVGVRARRVEVGGGRQRAARPYVGPACTAIKACCVPAARLQCTLLPATERRPVHGARHGDPCAVGPPRAY